MRWKKGLVLGAILMVVTPAIAVLQVSPAFAAQITGRTLTLQEGVAGFGGSTPGEAVNHKFDFTIPSGTAIGSILFEYCTSASVDTCVLPTGVDTDSATLGTTSGWATGASLVTGSPSAGLGKPYLSKAAASGAGAVSVILQGVDNPTAANETFFVRISTYVATDATGTPIDEGTVAASTAEPIILTGTMPESLIFCTGGTVTLNCLSTTTASINFDQLFSPLDTATATSQMAASTNASSGYVITVNGDTLTSGGNTIAPMATATTSTTGIGQFGMNLVLNTITDAGSNPLGLDVSPSSDATDLKANPTADYATADTFKYLDGDTVAQSDDGGLGPTNSQIYTASYIVNVPGNQPAGTYVATLTYICTASY